MKHLILGALLALCVVFPHAAWQGAAPIETAAVWLASQTPVWVFAAAAAARPWIARRLSRRAP